MSSNITQALLNWFIVEPVALKSFDAIDLVCKNLWRQRRGNENEHYAKYEYFYPLIRSGVVEFYGDGMFSVAPTAAVYNEKNIILINAPETLRASMVCKELQTTIPGILIVPNISENIQTLKKLSVTINRFCLQDCLMKISIKNAVDNWTDIDVLEKNDFDFFNGGWVNGSKIDSAGIYKRSSRTYSERLCKLNDMTWKMIPSRKSHFDSFSIALTYFRVKNSEHNSFVCYNSVKRKISINDFFFPIAIERLLFFNTLLQANPAYDPIGRNYYLAEKTFFIINRIVGQISLVNE